MLEAAIESAFVERAKMRGWTSIKLTGQKGIPDRLVLLDRGLVAFIEFKRPGGAVAAAQKRWVVRLRNRGFPTAIADSVSSAMAFCESVIDFDSLNQQYPDCENE